MEFNKKIVQFQKKNFLLLGYQKAALSNLKESLKINSKTNVKLYDIKKFNYKEIKKSTSLEDVNRNKILKYIKNYNIILGTSELELESNLANFFFNNKIDFYCYVDSNVNMKIRFENFSKFPKKIITLNRIVISQIKKEFFKESRKTRFYDLKMPYQNNLKNKYSHYLRNDQIILYLSSHIGIFEDKKNIKILTKHNHNKKVYVIIHPREKKDFWIKKFKMEKKVKIFKDINFYKNKNIKKVYGVSTMALINYKFAGFDVFYFYSKYLVNNPFMKFIKHYKIKKVI